MSDQRTEKASPQRKKKARDSGDVVRSRDLLSAAGMLAGLLAMGALAPEFASRWRESYEHALRIAATVSGAWGEAEIAALIHGVLLPALIPAGAVMAAAFAAVVCLGVAQGGGIRFNAGSLAPKFERLDPATHIGNLFSLRALLRVAKSLAPALIVATMGWSVVHRILTTIPVMGLDRLPETFSSAYSLGIRAAWVLVVWAAIDYAVEFRAWNQRLKMSKQDMREEVKEAMGNPQVKGRIRSMQRQMARRKAKVDMRRASVVITNPTHYAVALEFSFETMGAPTVLTKGRDVLALDIREEARWAGIPIVENPPLARSLYRAVEPGRTIPYELYSAVAGVLAFLFRDAQEKKARDNRHAAEARAERERAVRLPSSAFAGGM
jgi:flagellar biosynthetic protein FlhB